MIPFKYVLSIAILLILGCSGEQDNPKKPFTKLPEVSQEKQSVESTPAEEAEPKWNRKPDPDADIYSAETITVNGYKIRIRIEYSPDGSDTRCFLTIFRGRKAIYSRCEEYGRYEIITTPPPGTDIDNDGIPDIILKYYSSGAHCCHEYTLISLGNKLKFSNILYGKDTENHEKFRFMDIDGDGRYEAIGKDWTFAYWNASFAGSPAPRVILRFKEGEFHLAEDLMKKPPPSRKSLRKNAYNLRKAMIENALKMEEPTPPGMFRFEFRWPWDWDSSLWDELLKLIYTGNGNLAWQYCDWYWSIPDEIDAKTRDKNKRDFIRAFKKQLAKSIYWEDLKKLNGWT